MYEASAPALNQKIFNPTTAPGDTIDLVAEGLNGEAPCWIECDDAGVVVFTQDNGNLITKTVPAGKVIYQEGIRFLVKATATCTKVAAYYR